MTMILTCLTKDYVVQASDRRISITEGSKVKWYDDQSNKAVIYANNSTCEIGWKKDPD
jgi:hypothetical protein